MDATRSDSIARLFAARRSRRQALVGAGAGQVAAGLAAGLRPWALAASAPSTSWPPPALSDPSPSFREQAVLAACCP